jgi:hypothetical protein
MGNFCARVENPLDIQTFDNRDTAVGLAHRSGFDLRRHAQDGCAWDGGLAKN